MTTAKLWELSADIETLESAIELIENDTNISVSEKESLLKDIYQQWLESDGEFEEKALNTASYIRHLESITNARKEEIKRLQALAKQSENQANRLKNYLAEHMKRTGKTKIEGITGKLSLRKKPAQLVINCDVDDLPEEYQIIERKADKPKLKEFIKEYGNLTFAQIVDPQDFSLIIK